MITKEQWYDILDSVLGFNRLVTTQEERASEAYTLKCFKLTDDEIEEFMEAEPNSEEELKECADILVTAIQSLDAITPSLLSWEHIEERIKCVVEDNNIRVVSNCISDVISAVIVDAETNGYDLYGAMCEVNASNCSKIPLVSSLMYTSKSNGFTSLEDYLFYLCDVIEEDSSGRYVDVTWSYVDGGRRVIFRDNNKKVLKLLSYYEEPKLSSFMLN